MTHSNQLQSTQGLNVSVLQEDGNLSPMVLSNSVLLSSQSSDSGISNRSTVLNTARNPTLSNISLPSHFVIGQTESLLKPNVRDSAQTLHMVDGCSVEGSKISANNTVSSRTTFVQFSDCTERQSEDIISYSNVLPVHSADLTSFADADSNIQYNSSSESTSQLVAYTGGYEDNVLVQDPESISASSGLVQYSEGREGLTMPLLTADNNLVNFVELGDGYTIDSTNLDGSVIIRPEFIENSGTVSEIRTNESRNDFSSMKEHKQPLSGVTYQVDECSTMDVEEAGLRTEYDNASSVDSGQQTVQVPVNFIHSGNFSIISPTLIRLANDQQVILMPPIASELIQSQNIIDRNTLSGAATIQISDLIAQHSLQQQALVDQQQSPGAVITLNNSNFNLLHNQTLTIVPEPSVNSSQILNTVSSGVQTSSVSGSVSEVPRGRIGRPPGLSVSASAGKVSSGSSSVRNRMLGTGPLAISAQGIIQQVGGRRVTVLPRPEDLQRLREHKALVVDLPDDKTLSQQLRRGPVPVRPYQRFGRARGSRRGRPPVCGGEATEDELLSPAVRGAVRRRGRRGRGRRSHWRSPRKQNVSGDVMVVNSGGRRPGRPRKAITLVEGPTGARMIYTGPDHTTSPSFAPAAEAVAGVQVPDNNMDSTKHNMRPEIPVSDIFDSSQDPTRRRLPPRNRGTKYSKMIEALIRPDDEIPSDSSDDDPDFGERGTSSKSSTRGTTLRTGRRGRPRKYPLPGAQPIVRIAVHTGTLPRPEPLDPSPRHRIILCTAKSKPSISYLNLTNVPNPLVPDRYTKSLLGLVENTGVSEIPSLAPCTHLGIPVTLQQTLADVSQAFCSLESCESMCAPEHVVGSIEKITSDNDEIKYLVLVADSTGQLRMVKEETAEMLEPFPSQSEDFNHIDKSNPFLDSLCTENSILRENEEPQSIILTENRLDDPGSFSLHQELSGEDSTSKLSGIKSSFINSDSLASCEDDDKFLSGQSMYDESVNDFDHIVTDNQKSLHMEISTENKNIFTTTNTTTICTTDNNVSMMLISSQTQDEDSHNEHNSMNILSTERGVSVEPEESINIYPSQSPLHFAAYSSHYSNNKESSYDDMQFLATNSSQDSDRSMSLVDPDSMECELQDSSYTEADRQLPVLGSTQNAEASSGVSLPRVKLENHDEMIGHGIVLEQINESKEDLLQETPSVIVIKEEQLDAPEIHHCEVCGLTTAFKRELIKHLRHEHNLRSYECSICFKTFTSIQTLQDHELIHSLERPHKCDTCGAAFEKQSALRAHLERVHLLDYSCDRCTLHFDTALQLKKHLALHDTSVTHICEHCGKRFSNRDMLDTHVNLHSTERQHTCDICKLSFKNSSGLNRHRKVHKRDDEDKDFWCSECYANFSYEESLIKHMQLVHNIRVAGDDIKQEEIDDSKACNEKRIVEELQEQLNEGYAPKTSELYDVPVVSETLESKFPSEPFRCGICEERFTDVDMMCDHFTNCHTSEQKFYCETCCVGCSSMTQLEHHRKLHEAEEANTAPRRGPFEFPHACSVCSKSYKTAQELSKHSRLHSVDKPYKCYYCSSSFPIKSALDKHLLVHTGERPFKCDVCLKGFRQSAALVRHKLWTHRLKNQNKCEFCGKTFFTARLLIYHLDVHGEVGRQLKLKLTESENVDGRDDGEIDDSSNRQGDEPTLECENNVTNKCEYCSRVFASYVALLTHKLTHKLSDSFKCEQCHRTFREKRYLNKHKLTHKGLRSWKCDICKKAFAAKLTLVRHWQVHLREALRPDTVECNAISTLPSVLKCAECGIIFLHKSHFVRHMLLHSGTPLLKCGLCDKMFVHKSDIIRHKVMHSYMFTCEICHRNFHKRLLYVIHKRKHVDERPFKCDVCGKSFATSSNCNAHRKTHSGDKPYKCDRCSYRCSQSSRLIKHKRMHTGEKPYLCSICGRPFANAESLKTHQRVHTGDRPYKCEHCTKSFINAGTLNQHVKEHAKEDLFRCEICHHKFKKQSHLDKHNKFHDQEQGSTEGNLYHMCKICGRVFDKKKYLYTHANVHDRSKNFSCDVCGRQLASRLALKNHELIHRGVTPFNCRYCLKPFRIISNLRRHEKTHDGQDVVRCTLCEEVFASKEDLVRHNEENHHVVVSTVTEDTASPLSVNDENTSNSSQPPTQLYVFEPVSEGVDSAHSIIVNEAHDPQHQQLFVDAGNQSLIVFPKDSGYELVEPRGVESQTLVEEVLESGSMVSTESRPDSASSAHHIGEHILSTPPTHGDFDGVVTASQSLSIDGDHTLIGDTSEPTKIVGVVHSRAESLQEVASEQAPGTIIQSLAFSASSDVQGVNINYSPVVVDESSVVQTSTVASAPMAKKHQCPVCHQTYAKKQYLTKHMYRHLEVKPHACDVCGKRFAQKFEVTVHKIKHSGLKPFTCDICNKSFRSKVNLNNHKMRHNGEFSFLCSVCSRGFSTQHQLEKHVALHTGMLPFNCEICGKGYSIKLNLEKHMMNTHGQEPDESEAVDTICAVEGNEEIVMKQSIDNAVHVVKLGNQIVSTERFVTQKQGKAVPAVHLQLKTASDGSRSFTRQTALNTLTKRKHGVASDSTVDSESAITVLKNYAMEDTLIPSEMSLSVKPTSSDDSINIGALYDSSQVLLHPNDEASICLSSGMINKNELRISAGNFASKHIHITRPAPRMGTSLGKPTSALFSSGSSTSTATIHVDDQSQVYTSDFAPLEHHVLAISNIHDSNELNRPQISRSIQKSERNSLRRSESKTLVSILDAADARGKLQRVEHESINNISPYIVDDTNLFQVVSDNSAESEASSFGQHQIMTNNYEESTSSVRSNETYSVHRVEFLTQDEVHTMDAETNHSTSYIASNSPLTTVTTMNSIPVSVAGGRIGDGKTFEKVSTIQLLNSSYPHSSFSRVHEQPFTAPSVVVMKNDLDLDEIYVKCERDEANGGLLEDHMCKTERGQLLSSSSVLDLTPSGRAAQVKDTDSNIEEDSLMEVDEEV